MIFSYSEFRFLSLISLPISLLIATLFLASYIRPPPFSLTPLSVLPLIVSYPFLHSFRYLFFFILCLISSGCFADRDWSCLSCAIFWVPYFYLPRYFLVVGDLIGHPVSLSAVSCLFPIALRSSAVCVPDTRLSSFHPSFLTFSYSF